MRSALYIENLPAHLGRAAIERLFRPYGSVREVVLATDPDMLRRHAGLAVVAMATPTQARAAVRALDGAAYRGGILRARPALVRDVERLTCMCGRGPRALRRPARRCEDARSN